MPFEVVQRHTVEHIVDDCPFVQILDVPVPQLGGDLVEFMQKLDTSTLEQAIAVPKISLDRIPQRLVDLLVFASTVLGGSLEGFSPGEFNIVTWRSSQFAVHCRAER